jgi:hypothetical protein
MKISVLHDKSGNIIAALIPLPQTSGSLNRPAGLNAGVDQHLSEIDVPEEYVKLVQAGKFEQLKIDIQGKQNTLMRKS